MDGSILDVVAYINEEDVDFIPRPIQGTRQSRHREALETTRDILAVPGADFFILLIFWPSVGGPLVQVQRHVHKAYLCEKILQWRNFNIGATELLRCLEEEVTPLNQ